MELDEASEKLQEVACKDVGGQGTYTRSRTAYPPWLLLSRRWGKVKEIYRKKGKKKKTILINSAGKKKRKQKNTNPNQNTRSNKSPVKKPATKVILKGAGRRSG